MGTVTKSPTWLTGRLRRIVDDGRRAGSLRAPDAAMAARAVFDATVRFHHPAHSGVWHLPDIDAQFEAVITCVVSALREGALE